MNCCMAVANEQRLALPPLVPVLAMGCNGFNGRPVLAKNKSELKWGVEEAGSGLDEQKCQN